MSSKFRGILDSAKSRAPGSDAAPPVPADAVAATTAPPVAPPSPAPTPRGPGRPPGKRSDPGFVQATAYLPAELHHGVKMALLQERRGREFSELVAELLAGWLESRPTA